MRNPQIEDSSIAFGVDIPHKKTCIDEDLTSISARFNVYN